MPNRLAESGSPYLRAHADNPVDWWPWGPEPFAEAVARDVPVLVSIGYSTCHWCHVMARESFADDATAAIVNDGFVAIKVDREQHPEVDNAYLAAASAFTPNLGWPLTVFVTPAGKAFFAGTYWPDEARRGLPAFRDVLAAVTDAWQQRRDSVETTAGELAAALGRPVDRLGADLDLDAVLAKLELEEDRRFGGFASSSNPAAPKFPVTPVLRFLLAINASLGFRALDATAGLADPVDGGFFRYATRADWTVPHYERMLSDNAQLLAAYATAAAAQPGSPAVRRRTELAVGIAGWMLDTLRDEHGAFRAAQDSESEIEGQRVEGAWFSMDAAARAEHAPPPVDGKILTGWNGLAIEALALAGLLLQRPDWIGAAAGAAERILQLQVHADADPVRLARSSLHGVVSDAPATLEDAGGFANGLLALALATGEVRWAILARRIVDATLTPEGTFALPGDPVLAAQAVVVGADPTDGAQPSGPSAIAKASHTLYLLTADARYREATERSIRGVAALASAQPLGFGAALEVAAALQAPVEQLVVVSDDPDAELAVHARTRPRGLSSVVTAAQAQDWAAAGFELYEGRTAVRGMPTAYACTDFVCRLPATSLPDLLGSGPSNSAG